MSENLGIASERAELQRDTPDLARPGDVSAIFLFLDGGCIRITNGRCGDPRPFTDILHSVSGSTSSFQGPHVRPMMSLMRISSPRLNSVITKLYFRKNLVVGT
jgi:hypothetical protein